MVKKRKLLISAGFSAIGILCLCLILLIQNKSNASRNENIKTGESLKTIDEVELVSNSSSSTTNITTYIGYGYNVATKGYIHEKNVNASSVDNMIFKMYPNNSNEQYNIRKTYVKLDNSSRTIDKEVIDARDMNSYLKQFVASMADKKLDLKDEKYSWIPFVKDVYFEIGGEFKKASLGTSKTAYVTDTMTKKSATVTWMLSEKEYYNYLTDSFKKDLMDLEPTVLFDRYGTHFFRSVVLGGKLQYTANVKASTEKELDYASASFKLNVSLKSGEKKDETDKVEEVQGTDNTSESTVQTVSTSGDNERKRDKGTSGDKDSIKSDKVNQDTSISIVCKANVYGGDANSYADKFSTIAGDIAKLSLLGTQSKTDNGLYNITKEEYDAKYSNINLDSTTYASWLKSVDNYPALIDIRDQYSLYPIWDLLDYFPDNDPTISEREAVARKEELEKAFNEYGLDNYNNIVKKYENETEDSLFTEIESEVTGVDYLSVYDRDDKLSENDAKIHEGFKLGNVYVTNAGKTSDGKYMLNDSSFEVSYKLAQDPNNLPLDSDLYYKHKLVSDLTHVSSVNGYGNIFSFWKQYAPMKGGYYVQVIYNDNQSDSESGCNLLKKKNKGDSVVMYTSKPDEVEKHGGVKEIKVLFIYKTQASSLLTSPFFKWLQEGTITFE